MGPLPKQKSEIGSRVAQVAQDIYPRLYITKLTHSKRLVAKMKFCVALTIVVFVDKRLSSSIFTPFKINSSFFFFVNCGKNGT